MAFQHSWLGIEMCVCVCVGGGGGGGGVAGVSTLSVFAILYAVKLGTSSFKMKFG